MNRTKAARLRSDEGSTLILTLVVIIVGAFFVLPMMTYVMTVNQASRLRIQGANSSEIVRGGLRSVLYDPSGLYSACSGTGVSAAQSLAVPPGLPITTQCTTVADTSQWLPQDVRWALTTTMVGSQTAIPPNYVAPPSRPELDGTISEQWCTSTIAEGVPCGRPYPGNGSAAYTDWFLPANATTTSTGSKIFLPFLPPVVDAQGFAGGYDINTDGAGAMCKVYFPGRYTDNVVITGTMPVYFVSGVYYFEKTLRFSGDAQVVIGAGATDGCIEGDAIAVADAGYADATSSGVGATFVFGAQGRMMVDTTTAATGTKGVSVVFNRRLVDPLDDDSVMNNVSIMSVNGSVLIPGITSDYNNPLVMYSPVSKFNVPSGSPSPDPLSRQFKASTLNPLTVPTTSFGCAAPPATVAATCPIVDINLTSTKKVYVSIPGYVAVPQGGVSINTASAAAAVDKKISFAGGILSGTVGISPDKPAYLQFGLLNQVVQKTFKIVSQTSPGVNPRVTATALVQVNQTGGYAINSWVTSFG
jgi:hypothetical protein